MINTIIFFICFIFQLIYAQNTRLGYTVISSITPSFGSVEGGTWITILGANFQSGGMFTNRLIFIGGQICKEIPYFTTSQRIICVAPPCVDPACLSDPTWQGSVTVSLNVYVQDVEAVYGTASTFTYHGSYTPQIFGMSKTIRGNAVAQLTGRMSTDTLTDIQIRIGENLAYIGDYGELNSNLNMWSYNQKLYYIPSSDMTAGFYNLTMQSQDDQSHGYKGTGFARMYPTQPATNNNGFPFGYNWDCSLSGNVYNVALQPVISHIEPSIGSIGGNTLVTITGSGFSKVKSQNVVLVGGLFCDVQNSDFETLTCMTRPHEDFNYINDITFDQNSIPSFQGEFQSAITRNYGSPGWWVDMWNYQDYQQNKLTRSNIRLSFGWRNEMFYGLYYFIGSSWPNSFNYQSNYYQWDAYAADIATYFIAPFSGDYQFYVANDDSCKLYGYDPAKSNHSETLLISTTYTYFGSDYYYPNIASHMSKVISLNRGQRYRLRARLINIGGPDYLKIGFKVTPDSTDLVNYDKYEFLEVNENQLDKKIYNYSLASLRNSSEFMHHHSFKTIQIVSLQIFYQREVQVIVITGIQGGTFNLILQDIQPTDSLSVASSANAISSALYNAAKQIKNAECNNFGVTTKVTTNGNTKNMIIRVEFYVDNSVPLTLLSVYSGLLEGTNVTSGVTRTQQHSVIPSGSFSLSYLLKNSLQQVNIPISADADMFRNLMKSIPDTHVEVTRSNSFYTGYTWTLTFITPRGDIPTLQINVSNVVGQAVNGTSVKIQNGSEDSFWFTHIPSYLTEVPLDIATKKTVKSNAEVYVQTSSGEYFKAVCDGSKDTDVLTSHLQGNESTCEFVFSTASTPIVSAFSAVTIDAETTGIQIYGNYFTLAGTDFHSLQVTISNHACNVSYFNETFITCAVKSVPWGQYQPVVNVQGYGNAVYATTNKLNFKQYIYSIFPAMGSFTGGQIITIKGRGFRPNATIVIGDAGLTCEMVEYSSSEIKCRSPAAVAINTERPSFSPTFYPTSHPTPLPTSHPTSVPTSHPTAVPTSHPTSVPTSHPTAVPTSHPTSVPTSHPTAVPTSHPTSVPTSHPTAVPTSHPTSVPTSHPTAVPTSHPTSVPTSHPTAVPTSYPSLHSRRRLSDDSLHNVYQLYVDGMTSVNPSDSQYQYSVDVTPKINSITPSDLSSGITYNVSMNGDFKPSSWNVSVMIGDEPCRYVNMTSTTLSCVLRRNQTFGSVKSLSVKVYIENIGYAGWFADLLTFPSVRRGFEINSILPKNGSVMGGNVLTLSGFGFQENYPERHSVQLIANGLQPLSDYASLLVDLGFNDPTSFYSEDAFVNCIPLSSTFNQLTCYLPGHQTVYNETLYNVITTLNSVKTVCSDVNNCSYVQAVSATPMLFSNSTIQSISSLGEYNVQVYGTFLSQGVKVPGSVVFTVNGLPCSILDITNSYAIIQTSSIPAGLHFINASISEFGFAYSEANISASSFIAGVQFASPVGSLAGGAYFTLDGYGFSPECEQNSVSLLVTFSDNFKGTVHVNEVLSCSTNFLKLRTPSVLKFSAHGNGTVTQIIFGITNSTASGASYTVPSSDFLYLKSYTPIVTVNATEGFTYQPLKILVRTLPGALSYDTLFNTVPCLKNVSFSSGNSLEQLCTVPFLPATPIPYTLFVNVHPYGYAIVSWSSKALPTFKSKIQVNKFAIPSSSIAGGSNLTITGSGFPFDTEITVCGSKCTTNGSITDTTFSCTLPQKLTINAVNSLQNNNIFNDFISTISGTYFSSLNNPASSTLKAVSDGSYNTYFQHYNKNCFVGIQLPKGYAAQPYRMRYYPRIQYATYIGNLVFEGLPLNSKSYVPLAYFNGARSGWNALDAVNNLTDWFVAFRYRALDTTKYSQCYLAEVEFMGTVAFINDTCPVVLSSASNSYSSNIGQVYYDFVNQTPEVSAIVPSNGSALGGETVTIHGRGFSAINSEVSVKFSGVDCQVVSSSDSIITCVTGARSPDMVETSSIKVLVGGKGYAVVPDELEYLYIDKWSALTSWKNQEPPVDGDVVWIPDGQVILLDENTPKLTFLLVEGSLYFDRSKDLTVDSYYIFVLGGYLEIGTHDEPFEKSVTITLHGDRYKSIDIPMIGDKFLAVSSKGARDMEFEAGMHMPSRYTGQLEVHGRKRIRTWTFVDHTAPAGSFNITTVEPVDFAAGDKIILTGNDLPTNGYQFEELTVSQNIDNHFIYFTTPLKYTHTSYVQEIEGRVIPMRCEIGLLSRNVVIQGDEDKSDGQLFGVHTIAFHSGIYHMENAELRRCGQAFNFGRYCTHSHEAGNMEGSYVKANSIHHSYQRAVTTHDTHNWEVRDNVAFNIQGHAYFVEEGAETENYLTGNLGIYILKSSALLMSDQKPAVFWTATPSNYWRDNVAVHSARFGFWFEPAGSIDTYCPVHSYIGEHWNNTVHSNSDIGLRIYPEYTPLANPCGNSGVPSPQYIYHLLSYHNGGNGIFSKRHGDIHHMYPVLVENGGHEISIVHYEEVQYTKNPAIQNALLVGTLPENYHSGMNLGKRGIWTPQNEYFYIRNVTFVNYGNSGAITGCNDCLGEKMKQGAFTTRYEQLKFVNSDLRLIWSPTYKEILWDLDGTLGGVPDSMITMYYDVINYPDVCTILPVETFSNSLRCGGAGSDVRIRRVQLDAVTPSQLSYTDVVVKSDVGSSSFYFLPMDTYGWVFPAVTGGNRNYTYIWEDAGISAYTLNLTYGRIHLLTETMNQTQYDESVRITYTPNYWDYTPYSFTTTYNGVTKYISVNTTKPLIHMADANFRNTTVEVLLNNKGANLRQKSPFNVYLQARLCPPRGCPVPPVPTLSDPMLWSKKGSWPSGKVPVAGQKVVIESNMWIVLDITPPNLGCIVVYGKLTFQSNSTQPKDLKLSAQCMQVFGTFEIAGPNKTPFEGNATVVLYGAKGSSLPITMTEGVFLGSKVIGVAGNLTAVGKTKQDSWVRLGSTANSGTTAITLSRKVHWSVGDEVILSPTSYFTAQGNPWFYNSSGSVASDEIRTIIQIRTVSGRSQIVLNRPLLHTHLCETHHQQTFCGAVGVLTRNVRFVSQDSQTSGKSFGYGGHIQVFDITNASPARLGQLELVNVEMKYFGKINSDHYGVTLGFSTLDHPASIIENCTFNAGYNFALRTTNVANVNFTNNVVARNWGGGVLLDTTSINYHVDGNLIVGSRQLPSVLLSSYPWVRPIAGISLENPSGTCRNNLVAGSEDQGFTIANAMFHSPNSLRSLCRTTSSSPYSYSQLANYHNYKFFGNEAVAGKGGLFVMAMGLDESSNDDCALVSGVFSWRNAHTGIMAIDSMSNILVNNVVLAENHIGLHLHFYKTSIWGFAGVVNSTIINSLSSTSNVCGNDLPDSLYLPGRQCHVFSTEDPLAQQLNCQSTLASMYKRVGVLVPLFTNKPRTCTMSGAFTCDPPNTPDRLCQMPWEKRYALPIPNMYSELHMHNVEFIGFNTSRLSGSSSASCIPTNTYDRTAAIALNPTEYDTQPTIITSDLKWQATNVNSRFSFEQGPWASECLGKYPCSGQDMLIWHDLDGSMNSLTVPGQLYQKNPEYIAPYAEYKCLELPEMSLNLYFCPKQVSTSKVGFQQFSGLWDDSGPQVIQPIVTTRKFSDRNVSIPSYGPHEDLCAMRFYYSQFNFLWADKQINRIVPTGTIPGTGWTIRWNAPSSDNVAIIEFFVQNSQVINVFVSDNGYDNYKFVPKQFTYPTLNDPAGTNYRNPQTRILAVTIRGGAQRFYKFVVLPVAAVTVKMDMTLDKFFSDTFIANMALLLQIPSSRIAITSVRKGSVIADFNVFPQNLIANDTNGVVAQINQLQTITTNLSNALNSGAMGEVLGVPIEQVFVVPPVVPTELDPLRNIPANSSYNDTQYRLDLQKKNQGTLQVILTFPTSMPTGMPTVSPTTFTKYPTSTPTVRPSRPTFSPSIQPTSFPTTRQPSNTPTLRPTMKIAQPTSSPTKSNKFIDPLKTLGFDAIFTITKADGTIFTDLSYENLEQTVSGLTNIPSSHFGQGQVLSWSNGRRLQTLPAPVPYDTTFIVSLPIWLKLVDYTQFHGNATKLYLYIENLLVQSLESGEFNSQLVEIAGVLNNQQLIQALVTSIELKNFVLFNATFSPTEFPTSAPSNPPTSRPTSSPTAPGEKKFLAFHAYLQLFNLSNPSISQTGQNNLVDAISLLTDVPTNQISYMGILDEIGPNVLGGGLNPVRSGRKLQLKEGEYYNALVDLQLNIPIHEFHQYRGDAERIYRYITELIDLAVKERVFETDLRGMNNNEFKFVRVFQVNFSTYSIVSSPVISHFPTLQPSAHPKDLPTNDPLPSSVDTITIQFELGVSQTDSISLSEQGELSILQTISNVLDISLGQVKMASIDSALRQRRRQLEEIHEMVLSFEIIVYIADYPEMNGNTTRIFNYLTQLLSSSIYAPERTFTNLLRSIAATNNANEILGIVVFDMKLKGSFTAFQMSASPTALPTQVPTSNNDGNGNNDGGDGGNNNNPYTPPVHIPSSDSNTLVQYKAIFWIKDLLSAKDFNKTSTNALLNSILVAQGSSYETVKFLGTREILSSTEILVATEITFDLTLASPQDLNATRLFLTTSRILLKSVNSQAFDAIFQGISSYENILNSKHAQVIQVSFEDFTVINATPMNPINKKSKNDASTIIPGMTNAGFMAMIILLGLAVVSMIVYYFYKRNQHATKVIHHLKSASGDKIPPLSHPHGQSTDEDLGIDVAWNMSSNDEAAISKDDVFILKILDDFGLSQDSSLATFDKAFGLSVSRDYSFSPDYDPHALELNESFEARI